MTRRARLVPQAAYSTAHRLPADGSAAAPAGAAPRPSASARRSRPRRRATRRSGRPCGSGRARSAISASGMHEQQVVRVLEEQQHGELQDEQADEEHPDEHAVDGRTSRPPVTKLRISAANTMIHISPNGTSVNASGESICSRIGATRTTKPASGQQPADRAVGAPAPRDEPARRERDAGERVDDVVARHGRAAVEEHRDQRGEARDGERGPQRGQNHALRTGAVIRLAPSARPRATGRATRSRRPTSHGVKRIIRRSRL